MFKYTNMHGFCLCLAKNNISHPYKNNRTTRNAKHVRAWPSTFSYVHKYKLTRCIALIWSPLSFLRAEWIIQKNKTNYWYRWSRFYRFHLFVFCWHDHNFLPFDIFAVLLTYGIFADELFFRKKVVTMTSEDCSQRINLVKGRLIN